MIQELLSDATSVKPTAKRPYVAGRDSRGALRESASGRGDGPLGFRSRRRRAETGRQAIDSRSRLGRRAFGKKWQVFILIALRFSQAVSEKRPKRFLARME